MGQSNHNGTWTLTQKEYQEMRADSARLSALEQAGVDNWEGYGHAMEILRGDDDE